MGFNCKDGIEIKLQVIEIIVISKVSAKIVFNKSKLWIYRNEKETRDFMVLAQEGGGHFPLVIVGRVKIDK